MINVKGFERFNKVRSTETNTPWETDLTGKGKETDDSKVNQKSRVTFTKEQKGLWEKTSVSFEEDETSDYESGYRQRKKGFGPKDLTPEEIISLKGYGLYHGPCGVRELFTSDK